MLLGHAPRREAALEACAHVVPIEPHEPPHRIDSLVLATTPAAKLFHSWQTRQQRGKP
jgi:hypothetical protein